MWVLWRNGRLKVSLIVVFVRERESGRQVSFRSLETHSATSRITNDETTSIRGGSSDESFPSPWHSRGRCRRHWPRIGLCRLGAAARTAGDTACHTAARGLD